MSSSATAAKSTSPTMSASAQSVAVAPSSEPFSICTHITSLASDKRHYDLVSSSTEPQSSPTKTPLTASCPHCKKDLPDPKSRLAGTDGNYCHHEYSLSTIKVAEGNEGHFFTSVREQRDDDVGADITGGTSVDDSVVMQKSHVAVYEINPRWGSRLLMFLSIISGVMCVLGGALCAEHHCKDLQFCPNSYEGHGDWCGPSGKDGVADMETASA
ncbi:hypothetical protein EDD11_002119 [Mortierella claussenii]|nr:hypothetical protein EDD11_002119 [Mortierella claussenii]